MSADDARMLSAVVDADLQLMRLAQDPAGPRSEEASVHGVKLALMARFPLVVFHVVRSEEEDP